jgi:hypothetical protein
MQSEDPISSRGTRTYARNLYESDCYGDNLRLRGCQGREVIMGTIIIIVLVILLLGGGGFGYSRYGYGGGIGIGGILLLVLILYLVFGHGRF